MAKTSLIEIDFVEPEELVRFAELRRLDAGFFDHDSVRTVMWFMDAGGPVPVAYRCSCGRSEALDIIQDTKGRIHWFSAIYEVV
jgi:hypothetical protein